jgi:hypothetical protein
MPYEMIQHVKGSLDNARVAASQEADRRGGGKGRSSRDVAMQGETEKKQEQALAGRGFNVNASVPRHKREYADAGVRFKGERMWREKWRGARLLHAVEAARVSRNKWVAASAFERAKLMAQQAQRVRELRGRNLRHVCRRLRLG